jgi:GNAT superfamily N-acetyltransferase
MYDARLRDASRFGHVYGATREVKSFTGDKLAGVANWLPPGAFPLSATRQLHALPHMAAAPRSAHRLLGYTAGMAKLHPAQPYWCLEVVGVDPEARGFGIGTRLLEPVLALADEPGQRCYLETMTERNQRRLVFGDWLRGQGGGARWGSRDDVNRESRRTAGVLRVHH